MSKLVEVHGHKQGAEQEGEEEEGEDQRGPSEAKLVLRSSRVEEQCPPRVLHKKSFNAQLEQLR